MIEHLKTAMRRSAERNRQRRDYRALLELEERFLRDIGISRDEVRGRMSSDRFVA